MKTFTSTERKWQIILHWLVLKLLIFQPIRFRAAFLKEFARLMVTDAPLIFPVDGPQGQRMGKGTFGGKRENGLI